MMNKKLTKLVKRPEAQQLNESPERITNETVAEHRDEVLGKARKLILPLQHSKHRIVLISIGLFIAAIISFFAYSSYMLYRAHATSSFMYRVTQVVPFPVARVGSDFVSYEDYLFELRHYIYYYENRLNLDFESEAGVEQLSEYRQRALDKVINDAYIAQIADEIGVSVTEEELDNQLTIAREQSRLGATEQNLEDSLRLNFDWSIADFRRSLRAQLLSQKVVAALDTATNERAQSAAGQLAAGTSFADVAAEFSDDTTTKDNGGEFPFLVTKNNRDLSVLTTDALFKLAPGEVSGVVNIGYALEILQNIESQGDQLRAAHILFTFEDPNTYINQRKEDQPTRSYISLD